MYVNFFSVWTFTHVIFHSPLSSNRTGLQFWLILSTRPLPLCGCHKWMIPYLNDMQSDCCHSPGEQYTLTQLKKIRLSCICLFYYDTRLRNFGTQCLICPECSSFFNHLFVFCCCCCCCCCCFK